MKVGGLLPITFRGASYNIPVSVWVPTEYPTRPATPYVTPTRGATPNSLFGVASVSLSQPQRRAEMDVVKGHPHVGADGMCYFPYCNQWNQSSTVLGLMQVMQETFSQNPPVTARAPGAAQTALAPAPVPAPPIYQQPALATGVGAEEQKV